MLDPQTDEEWALFRQQAHTFLDLIIDHKKAAHTRERVWQRTPPKTKAFFGFGTPEEGGSAAASVHISAASLAAAGVQSPNQTPPHFKEANEAVVAPRKGVPLKQILEEVKTHVMPFASGNDSGRFFGWVVGAGSASGLLADLAVSVMNSNCGGGNHVASHIEKLVVRWLASEFFGASQEDSGEASGVLVECCSTANLVSLVVARHWATEGAVRQHGVQDAKLVLYESEEGHSSVQRAVEVMGLGAESLRRVPVDAKTLEMDMSALQDMIVQDRKEGWTPFCIVGSAGTVNTGAFDDLEAIADLCEKEKLWFHVDGAFGAFAKSSPTHAPKVQGIARADSMAFDLHKVPQVTYGCAAALVRNGLHHMHALSVVPSYLAGSNANAGKEGEQAAHDEKAHDNNSNEVKAAVLTKVHDRTSDNDLSFLSDDRCFGRDYSIDLSRSNRALKVWWHFREHGFDKVGELVDTMCRHATLLGDLVTQDPLLHLMAPVTFNITAFYFADPSHKSLDDVDYWNAFNERLLVKQHQAGLFIASSTYIVDEQGRRRWCHRPCFSNHVCTDKDVTSYAKDIVAHGQAMIKDKA